MISCLNCGEKIIPDADFCHKCGTKLSDLLDKPLSEKEYLDLVISYGKKLQAVDESFLSVSKSLHVISVDSTLEKIDKIMNRHSTLSLEFKLIRYPEIYEKFHMLWISVYDYSFEAMSEYRKAVEYNDQEYLDKAATVTIGKISEYRELAMKEFYRIQDNR